MISKTFTGVSLSCSRSDMVHWWMKDLVAQSVGRKVWVVVSAWTQEAESMHMFIPHRQAPMPRAQRRVLTRR